MSYAPDRRWPFKRESIVPGPDGNWYIDNGGDGPDENTVRLVDAFISWGFLLLMACLALSLYWLLGGGWP